MVGALGLCSFPQSTVPSVQLLLPASQHTAVPDTGKIKPTYDYGEISPFLLVNTEPRG